MEPHGDICNRPPRITKRRPQETPQLERSKLGKGTTREGHGWEGMDGKGTAEESHGWERQARKGRAWRRARTGRIRLGRARTGRARLQSCHQDEIDLRLQPLRFAV